MSAPSLVERLKACAVSSRAHGQDNSARHFDEAAARITTLESALYGQTFSADPRDARIAELEAENALLRDHIAEQITHVETRIQDGRAKFSCRVCDAWTDWDGEPGDFEDGHYANVCGGSPRCCP